jgi:formate dehydrogenase iron-sulfur subunit
LQELQAKAAQRLTDLHGQGVNEAQLYGADKTVYGGLNAFFLLMDKPESYGLPNAENAVLPSRNNERGYLAMLVTGALAVIGGLIALRRRREPAPEVDATPEPERVP